MIGVDSDVFTTVKPYTEYRKDELERKGRIRVRRKGELALVIMGVLPELIAHRKEITSTLFLPLAVVQSVRERCTKALVGKYGDDLGISHGDIITAILLKVYSLQLRKRMSMKTTNYSSSL